MFGAVNEHEVYPAAPIVLVALEVKHPPADPLTRSDRARLKAELAKRTPVLQSRTSWGFQMSLGSNAALPQGVSEEFPKFFTRSLTAAISYQAEAIVVECTHYAGWRDFIDLARMALEARDRVAPIDGVVRVGLRYINEVRVPEQSAAWSRWIHHSLLQPEIDVDLLMPLSQWQGLAVYGETPGRALALRYGPKEGTTMVQPNPELKQRYQGPYGEFFLIDLDSFAVPKDGTPPYDAQELIDTCNDLHEPIRTLFEGIVTPRLRNEVLRNDGSNQPA